MKPGEICKCISDFNGSMPGEIILCKNDIVQIHKVIDKLWLEGEGGGMIGRFPSSIAVKTEIPTHPLGAALYVAIADFHPLQDGDLPLTRGAFVTEINTVDQDWSYGELYGRKGHFPLNYVWKINKTLLSESDVGEKEVRMIAKVLVSSRAQLPEELNLYAGDHITITHIIDEDWYRGECHGETGILPSSLVEIIERNVEPAESRTSLSKQDSIFSAEPIPVSSALINDDYPGESSSNGGIPSDTIMEEKSLLMNHSNQASNQSSHQAWKQVSAEDEALFNDDYFKMNLPTAYTTSSSANVYSETSLPTHDEEKESEDVLLPLDSLSCEVERILNIDNSSFENNAHHQDLMDIDFTYTEDNTGINPYGRAVFSFTAQYPNELTFRKGDIIHLIRHIDSHWTVGKLGIAKGIFPTSYIDIIVDCPHRAEEVFEKRLESADDAATSKKAIVCFDYDASDPADASGKEGDLVLITKFVSENWVEVETADGKTGLFPLNRLNVLQEELSHHQNDLDDLISINTTKRSYAKEDFTAPKQKDIDSALSKNLSSLDTCFKHSKPVLSRARRSPSLFEESSSSVEVETTTTTSSTAPISRTETFEVGNEPPTIPVSSLPSDTTREQSRSHEPPPVPSRTKLAQANSRDVDVAHVPTPSQAQGMQEDVYAQIVKENSVPDLTSPRSISRDTSFKSSDFPEDISSSSLSQHNDSIKTSESASSELNPQRPAPPPPLTLSESDENEDEFYSLPSENDDSVSVQESVEEGGEPSKTEPQDGGLCRQNTRARKSQHLKREAINELVTTEHEYIHDLQSLIQVVKISKNRKEAAAVDLKLLMGNLDQVVELSKKFLRELNAVSYNDDDDLMIGPVFVGMAEEMCEVYKIYSANNSISVGPLLQKYQEGATSAAFLNLILRELRQHKVNLLDMQAVLIKPVQRVLKYPLFIDNLVQNTPPSHPDYKNLEDAKMVMLNVAKEINEYTKRLDLVTKYRQSSHHSFGEKLQRVSMRTVAKKGSRIRTRISATMGLITKTKDLKFEEEETKFRSLVKGSIAVAEQGVKLVESVRGRHRAELGIIEAIASALLLQANNPQIEAIRNTCRDTCNRILPKFERLAQQRSVDPCRALLNMCSAPEHLIQKRYDKLLDFDKAQHKLDKNRDPTKTRILEEELKQAQGNYDGLNMQLLMDLPVLNEHGNATLALSLRSLVSARMNLEGHMASLYLKLAQMPSFSNLSNEEYLNIFKSKYANQMILLKKLSFVSPDFAPKSPKFLRGKGTLRKSLMKKEEKKRSSIDKTSVNDTLYDKFETSMIYEVSTDHPADEVFELSLQTGTVVGVIKKKDPSGSSKRWFVDDGEKQGFVRSCCLHKLAKRKSPSSRRSSSASQTSSRRVSSSSLTEEVPSTSTAVASSGTVSNTPVDTTPHQVPPQNQPSTTTTSSSSSTSLHPGQRSSGAEAPPRYEDIFPIENPLPEEPLEDFGNKEENIYEEIDQACGGRYENIDETEEETDGHVYEALTSKRAQGTTREKEIFFPEPDEEAAQFYYSLYHFGGGDANQLSLHEGQVVLLLFAQGSEWWFVEDRGGHRGYVPASYLSKYT